MRISSCAPRRGSDASRRERGGSAHRLARVVGSGVLSVLALLSRPAHAQQDDAVHVERDPGAEDCPDTEDLAARVATVVGHPSDPRQTRYVVTFARTPQTYTATIRSGVGSGTVRQLSAREPNCAALAHATTVALAVLLDADLSGQASDADANANANANANTNTPSTATGEQPEPVQPAPRPAPTTPGPVVSAQEPAPEPPAARLGPFVDAGLG